MSNYTESEIETILKHSGLYSNTLKKSEYPVRNVIRTVAGGSNGVFNLYKINSEPTEIVDKPTENIPETTNKPTETVPETPETIPETPETPEPVDKPTEPIPEGIISPLGLITPHGVVSELTIGKINPIGLIKPHGLITETPNNQINEFVNSLLSGFKDSNNSQKIPETTEETPEITKTPDKFYSWVIEKTPENNSELIEKEPEQTKKPKLPEVPKDYGINAREYDIANDLVFKLDSYRKDFANPIELESLEDTFILYNKGLYASPVVESFDNNFITSGDISKFLGTEITPTEFNENTSELDIISKVKYYLNSFLVMISELFEAVTKGTMTMQKFIDIVLQPSKLIGLAIVLLLISLFVFIRNY